MSGYVVGEAHPSNVITLPTAAEHEPPKPEPHGRVAAEVQVLNVVTNMNIEPDRVLEAALAHDLDSVVVLGYDKDGEEYLASSIADGGTVLWLMERLKHKLITGQCGRERPL